MVGDIRAHNGTGVTPPGSVGPGGARAHQSHRATVRYLKSGWQAAQVAVMLRRMQVLTPRRDERPRATTIAAVAARAVVAGAMLVAAVAVAWLDLASPLLRTFEMPDRPTAGETLVGVIVWAAALGLPAVLFIVGAVRLFDVTERLAWLRRRSASSDALATRLGDGYVVSDTVRLPDGSVIPRIVLGPHGLAVLEFAPPRAATRHRDGRWEVRLRDGRWVAMENPLDRASRDAERVRRWFAADDRDFVLKVHAALVAPDVSLRRTPTCAVITGDQIPAWIGSLPAQRTLTPGRRDRIARILAERI